MRRTERVRVATGVVDIAVPSRSRRAAGINMAGFHGRADGPVDLQIVPYPALTVFIDFDDVLLFESATDERKRGSVVVGLAPGRIRAKVCRRDVDCLQVRLSPVAAHAVLGSSPDLGGTMVALEELWGSRSVSLTHSTEFGLRRNP